MAQIAIVCPHCQLSRNLPPDKVPPQPVTATCPRCKERFTFDPAAAGHGGSTPPPAQAKPAGGPLHAASAPELPAQSTDQASLPPVAPPPPTAPATEALREPPRPTPAAIGTVRRPSADRPAQSRRELRGIGELLGDSWQVFQRRFGTLFTIYLLFLVVGILPFVLGAGLGVVLAMVLPIGKGLLITLCTLIGGIAGILGLSWGWGAMVAATLDETLDTRAAFARGKEMLLPFAWVCFLAGFVIAGGFLLLVIPGIIFSVWFFFAQFVLADDDTRGMSALFKSRALMAGRWFDVFLRLLVIWACSVLVGTIPVVGALLMLVATPYILIYQALLYRDLKELAGPVIYPCGTADYAKVVGTAAVGYILIPALVAGTFGVALYQKLAPFVGKGKVSLPAEITLSPGGTGGMSAPEGGYRVIPIPGPGGSAPSGTDNLPSGSPAAPFQTAAPEQRQKAPQHIHVFIYAVNYAGSVKANGVELKELETKPDMQYNYNLNGEKLAFGRNSITVDYAPISGGTGTMTPRLHLKVSYWKGSDRQVLGDWEIKDQSAGQKSFDFDIAEHM